MKNYRITVNGVSYEVTVEELPAQTSAVPAPAQATPAPEKPVPAPKPAVSAASAAAVKAPMAGTINRVCVQVGDAVKKGQTLLVLEAMKMENDICAPADGTVAAVHAAEGSSVAAGDPLVSLS